MCISLIRHFECEQGARHVVKNQTRCSIPPHTMDWGLNSVGQYCFLVPVVIEEYYWEVCPDCTGEGQISNQESSHRRVTDMDQLPDYDPR